MNIPMVRLGVVIFAAIAVVGANGAAQAPAARRPVAPVEPIGAILDAFATHPIVALCDAHGNEQSHAFLLSLLRHPRFAATVDDIVVEFGGAKHQDVIDRFVRGEEIPLDTLRQVWRNTTMPHGAADLAMYEEVFRTVREVNSALPPARRLRVLLGDPPIDWAQVRTREDHFTWLAMRDSYPAALMQVEVLAKKRRALLVYGQLHFQRQNLLSNYDMTTWPSQTIVSLLERSTPVRVFTVWSNGATLETVLPEVKSWPAPRLATINGTVLGAEDFASYVRFQGGRTRFQDGKPVPIPKDEWRSMAAEEQIDAVLYLGPESAMTTSQLPPALCREPGYIEMRLARIAAAGGPKVEAERLKTYCAGLAP